MDIAKIDCGREFNNVPNSCGVQCIFHFIIAMLRIVKSPWNKDQVCGLLLNALEDRSSSWLEFERVATLLKNICDEIGFPCPSLAVVVQWNGKYTIPSVKKQNPLCWLFICLEKEHYTLLEPTNIPPKIRYILLQEMKIKWNVPILVECKYPFLLELITNDDEYEPCNEYHRIQRSKIIEMIRYMCIKIVHDEKKARLKREHHDNEYALSLAYSL